jgi:hypothetical protein
LFESFYAFFERLREARCQWLTPVILAPWEERSGRSWFQANPSKKDDETPFQCMVVCACHPSSDRKCKTGLNPGKPGQKQDLSQK